MLSAKLHALHARLQLPATLPMTTLARTLVCRSADGNPDFNNVSLAFIGHRIISLYMTEYLLVQYPRLPLAVLYSCVSAYAAPTTLTRIAKEWGVETAAAPGGEVDPGLLQYVKVDPSNRPTSLEEVRTKRQSNGFTSRVLHNDEFGDVMVAPRRQRRIAETTTDAAHAKFVRALVGAIALHSGRDAARAFIKAHMLSRNLDLTTMFRFEHPVRDLSRLCARENFEYPVARILSETGRRTRHPLFVVGIYSGNDKLGEGSAPNLNEARLRAAAHALKAWYLYSPGKDLELPSDHHQGSGKKWDPLYIDVGEVI